MNLLKAVSNAQRCIVPGEYGRVLAAGKRMEKELGIGPLFRSWFRAANQEKMSGQFASCLHRDSKDYGLSCLVPWGQHEGGNLVLVQLGMKVELKPRMLSFFAVVRLLMSFKSKKL